MGLYDLLYYVKSCSVFLVIVENFWICLIGGTIVVTQFSMIHVSSVCGEDWKEVPNIFKVPEEGKMKDRRIV